MSYSTKVTSAAVDKPVKMEAKMTHYPMIKPCLSCGKTKDIDIEYDGWWAVIACIGCYDYDYDTGIGGMTGGGATVALAIESWNEQIEDALDTELDSIVEATNGQT